MSKFNRPTLNVISILCFFATLLISCWFSVAIAVPIQVAQTQTPSDFQETFYSYLSGKYTTYLGEDSGACAYSIDPTDVYGQGNNRFVTARIHRGRSGDACIDVTELTTLQADCQTNKSYEILGTEISRGPTNLGRTRYFWDNFEVSLTEFEPRTGDKIRTNTSEDLASKICTLPVRSITTGS